MRITIDFNEEQASENLSKILNPKPKLTEWICPNCSRRYASEKYCNGYV